MTVHKEGYTSIALCILFIALLNAGIQFYKPEAHQLQWFVYILSFLLFAGTLLFFRNPSVKISPDATQVLCPADGKIISIEETIETRYLKEKCIQISLSTSLINAHINRNPVSGVVKYFSFHAENNEGTTVAMENGDGVKVVLKQVAAAPAGRGVWYVKEGDRVLQGAQLGFDKIWIEDRCFCTAWRPCKSSRWR